MTIAICLKILRAFLDMNFHDITRSKKKTFMTSDIDAIDAYPIIRANQASVRRGKTALTGSILPTWLTLSRLSVLHACMHMQDYYCWLKTKEGPAYSCVCVARDRSLDRVGRAGPGDRPPEPGVERARGCRPGCIACSYSVPMPGPHGRPPFNKH